MRFSHFPISLLCFLAIAGGAYAFDINSLASGAQQKSSPEQWVQKGQIPNYDESRLQNPQGMESSQSAQKFMDLANQLTSTQFTYTCSMIQKAEDKAFFKCEADGSVFPSQAICEANCFALFNCQQENCNQVNLCAPYQVCPLGNFPCTGNSCTETGICSSTLVPYTQYQCPTDGKTYGDLSTCNSKCIQAANCNYNYVPQYTCPYNGATYSDSTTCSNNCYQTAYCSGSYNPVSASGNIPDWGGGMFGAQYYQVTGSGNTLYFYTGQMNFLFGVQWTLSGSISLSGGVTFSGSLSWDAGHCSSPRPGLISASGNSLYFYGYCGGWVYLGSIAVYGATPSGSAGNANYWPYSLGSMSSSGASINFYRSSNYSDYVGTISFSGNILSYTCPLGGYSCAGSPPYCVAYYGCNNTSYSYYSSGRTHYEIPLRLRIEAL